MPSLKKFSPESIKDIARNPKLDLQLIGIYSRSDIQHHIRTQQFQEFITKNNPSTKNYENLQKPQDFQSSTHKTTVDTLKI